jgi:hypothetical protein
MIQIPRASIAALSVRQNRPHLCCRPGIADELGRLGRTAKSAAPSRRKD